MIAIAIVGPTGSGKTSVSIELAKRLNAEIISADSRQIYKHIPIATAIPSKIERQGISHYFMEIFELEKNFNAGEFGKLGRDKINEIFKKGKLPLIVGGSGLYIKSLIDGFFEAEIKDDDIRKKLEVELEKKGKEYLHKKLEKIDPDSAKKISPYYFRRVIRAIEVYYISGKKMSELQIGKTKVDFRTIQFSIMQDRKDLYERINKRVDLMIENGLLEEVEKLIRKRYHYKKHNSLNTVGIKEVFKYFENEYTYEQMVNYIKQNSRRYAKRQLTWFRSDKRINIINAEKDFNPEELSDKIINIYKKKL